MERKKNNAMGKRRIEIKRLESEEVRYVCFSKRKMGIFTKASHLATLCGAEIAVVLNSPRRCPYTFGTPGVSQIVDRFLSGGLISQDVGAGEARQLSAVKDLNHQCMKMSNHLGEAKKKKAELEKRKGLLKQEIPRVKRFDYMEKFSLVELLETKKSLSELKKKVEFRLSHSFNGGASSSNCVNSVMMQDLFGRRTSQARLTVKNSTMMIFLPLGENQTTLDGANQATLNSSRVDHDVVMKRVEIDLNQPAVPSDDME